MRDSRPRISLRSIRATASRLNALPARGPRALSFQVESDSALKPSILSIILSEKSATFRDHALRLEEVPGVADHIPHRRTNQLFTNCVSTA